MDRGIVIVAGGRTYFANAYLNVALLRGRGCALPVEWFHLGPEMRPEWIAEAEALGGVRCIDLGGDGAATKDRGGWQAKILAIRACSFDEALYIDADSFPLGDPARAFDWPEFREAGAVLWPDIGGWSAAEAAALSRFFGIEVRPGERPVEAGQMLFDRARCAAALERVAALNADWRSTYRVVYGDKDTFGFGFRQAGQPYAVPASSPALNANGLIQHDFAGRPAFAHLTGRKWAMHGRSPVRAEGFPQRDRSREILSALSARLRECAP